MENKLELALLGIQEKIGKLIGGHQKEIEEAFAILPDDDPLTINFSAKIAIVKGKKICEVGISFVKEKIKDSCQFSWEGTPLFDAARKEEGLKKIAKELHDGIKKGLRPGESVTIDAGGKSVTIKGEPTVENRA